MADHHDEVKQDAVRSDRLWIVYCAIVFGYAASNTLLEKLNPQDVFEMMTFGWVVSQPMLLAVWAGLGPGSLVIRLASVLTALAGLILSSSVRNINTLIMWSERSSAPQWPPWLDIGMAAGQLLTFVAIVVASFAFGRFGGWRIARHLRSAISSRPRAQFGLRYVLGMMTVWAIILGVCGRIAYGDPFPFFGLDFMLIFEVISSVVALPSISFSMLFLAERITIRKTVIALSLVMFLPSLILLVIMAAVDEPIDLGVVLIAVPALLVGAVISGSVAAWPLRFVGFRLVRYKPGNGPYSTLKA